MWVNDGNDYLSDSNSIIIYSSKLLGSIFFFFRFLIYYQLNGYCLLSVDIDDKYADKVNAELRYVCALPEKFACDYLRQSKDGRVIVL